MENTLIAEKLKLGDLDFGTAFFFKGTNILCVTDTQTSDKPNHTIGFELPGGNRFYWDNDNDIVRLLKFEFESQFGRTFLRYGCDGYLVMSWTQEDAPYPKTEAKKGVTICCQNSSQVAISIPQDAECIFTEE